MKKQTYVLIGMVLLGLSIFSTIEIRQVKGVSASDILEEIDTPTNIVYSVATISDGTMFYGDSRGNIYKTQDGGSTWTLDFNEEDTADNKVTEIFTDSDDNLYFWIFGNGSLIKRYASDGSYKEVASYLAGGAKIPQIWHFTQAPNGSIYFNVYGTSAPPYCGTVWGSHDVGETWTLSFNVSAQIDIYHSHSVRADPYTGNLWFATGDVGNEISIWFYNHTAESWTKLSEGKMFQGGGYPTQWGYINLWLCDFAFDEDYVYFGADTGHFKVQRCLKTGNITTDTETVLRGDEWSGRTHFVRYMEHIDDIFFMNTQNGMMWASWDGEHWVALYGGGGSGACWGLHKTNDFAYFSADITANKLLKFYVNKEILQHLFYKAYVSVDGDTITFEKTIKNGSELAIDLAEYGIVNPRLTLTGVSQQSMVTNGSFEDGTLIKAGSQSGAGWYERYGKIALTSDEYHDGSQCLNFTPHANYLVLHPSEFHEWGTTNKKYITKQSNIYVASFWVKANAETASDYSLSVKFYYKNATEETYKYNLINVTTTWEFNQFYAIIPSWATHISWGITSKGTLEHYIDQIQLEYFKSDVCDSGTQVAGDRQFLSNPLYAGFSEDEVKTTNPSVTIAGTSYAHSGELNNNTDSETWDLNIQSGIVSVSASVEGSGQVKMTITGTTSMTSSNVVVYGTSNNVFYGVYYGTMTMTGGPQFAVLSPIQADVSINQGTVDFISFSVDSFSGFTSTIKLYCGTTGKPKQVTGATEWSYDSAMKIATIQVVHSSSVPITVSWGSALGTYPLYVSVMHDGFPTWANVMVDGDNRTIYGSTTFDLTWGIHLILVYHGDQRQTKSVTLTGPSSIGFNFETQVSQSWGPVWIWSIPLLIVAFGVAYVFFFRKK